MPASLELPVLRAGNRLDRYELLCPLGYGGMASVWLARFSGKLGFERWVVIKTILPHFAHDAQFQQMFVDEARIASGIEHPNVARILDVGEQDGLVFMVLEWVDGDSLSSVLAAARKAADPVPVGVALRVASEACAGLHAAHELKNSMGQPLGVVHRDVSPQNILLGIQGVTKIIDFGVAKAHHRLAELTNAGELKGKVRYMAPEQATGGPCDRRADVWAVGAVLYEMLTGAPPFAGATEVQTLQALTSGRPAPPLPSSVRPSVRHVIERSLQHDPDARFGTAAEMQLALDSALAEEERPASTVHVATFVTRHVGDKAGTRKQTILRALQALAQHPRPPEPGSSSGVKVSVPRIRNGEVASDSAGSAEHIEEAVTPARSLVHPVDDGAPRSLAPTVPDDSSLPRAAFPDAPSTSPSEMSGDDREDDDAPFRPRISWGRLAIAIGAVSATAIVGLALLASTASPRVTSERANVDPPPPGAAAWTAAENKIHGTASPPEEAVRAREVPDESATLPEDWPAAHGSARAAETGTAAVTRHRAAKSEAETDATTRSKRGSAALPKVSGAAKESSAAKAEPGTSNREATRTQAPNPAPSGRTRRDLGF